MSPLSPHHPRERGVVRGYPRVGFPALTCRPVSRHNSGDVARWRDCRLPPNEPRCARGYKCVRRRAREVSLLPVSAPRALRPAVVHTAHRPHTFRRPLRPHQGPHTMSKHPCLPRVKGKGALKRKATEAARVQLPFRPQSTTANTSPDTATPSPPSPLVPQEEEEEEIILDLNDHASLVDPPAAVPAESEDDPHQEDSEKLSDDDVDGNNPIPGRPRKATSIILSEEVERDLGEWLEHEVPYVYTKGHKDHMDRAKVGINLLLLALV